MKRDTPTTKRKSVELAEQEAKRESEAQLAAAQAQLAAVQVQTARTGLRIDALLRRVREGRT